MKSDNMSRRDALKIMGAGVTGLAAASVLSPVSYASEKAVAALTADAAAGFPLDLEEEAMFMAAPQEEDLYKEKLVYKDENVIFRQIDEHTWHGHGHLVYNESIYIVEGENASLVIDAGTRIPGLAKIVAGITSKPIIFAVTHLHGDHAGSAIQEFPEMYVNAGGLPIVRNGIKGLSDMYKGEVKWLEDGQVFDLGGREIEVMFTPGHTPGCTTFFDKKNHYGFSGDSFGSTNLLLNTNLSTLIATTTRTAIYMQKYGIEKLYPGHYHGNDCETLQRVLDEKQMAEEVLDGKRKPQPNDQRSNLNVIIKDRGVTIRFRDPQGIK